jgi:hypothetical protein
LNSYIKWAERELSEEEKVVGEMIYAMETLGRLKLT